MAIDKVTKVLIAVHESSRDRFFQRLQRLGVMHVTRDETAAEAVRAGGRELDRLGAAIEFLTTRADKKLRAKPVLDRDEFERAAGESGYQAALDRLDRVKAELAESENRARQLAVEQQRLRPWRGLEHDVAEVHGLRAVQSTFVRFPGRAEFEQAKAALAGSAAAVQAVGADGAEVFGLLVQAADAAAEANAALAGVRHETVDLRGVSGRPVELLTALEREERELATRKAALQEETAALGAELPKLKVAADVLGRDAERADTMSSVPKTASVRLLHGWVRNRDLAKLRRLVEQTDAAVLVEDTPAEGEEPPVALVNRPVFRPFEMVLDLFTMPSPRELDPTWLVAAFFGAFFGLCLTDAGYGLIVALVAFLILRRQGSGNTLLGFVYIALISASPLLVIGVREWTGSIVAGWVASGVAVLALTVLLMRMFRTGNKLLGIILIGAIITVPAGALVGGWFGDMFTPERLNVPALTRFKDILMWFDPVKDPMKFFVLSVALGVVQVLAGIAFEIADCLRVRNWGDGLLGQLPWFVLLTGLTVRAVFARGLGVWGGAAAVAAVLASVAAIIVFTQRSKETLLVQWLWFGAIAGLFVFLGAKFRWVPPAFFTAKWVALAFFGVLFVRSAVSLFATGKVKVVPVVLGALTAGALAAYFAGLLGWLVPGFLGVVFISVSPASKGLLSKLLWGGYALYGATGYIGVVLSYIRLMALGMCTGGVAVAINVIAWMLLKTPVVGIPLALLVLIGGHAYNIAVNVLGAFVHSLRLQYVEFFPRFYSGGGERFQPFVERFSHVSVKS